MKKYIAPLILLILLVQGCRSQKNKNQEIMVPEVNNQFEKFDIETFNAESIRGKRIETSAEFYIEEDTQSFGYARQIFPHQSYFSVLKLYYKNSFIKEKGFSFNNGSEIGEWYTFDESGKLTGSTNTDENYAFGYLQLIEYCEQHKINLQKGHADSGFQTSVYKEKDEKGTNIWVITHQIAGDRLERITLDGGTGKVLETEAIEFINH
ncbi:hypothetical protein FGM00_01435 [Aggregatimonas sangjinii]|uniref:Lipoprotein n=1 Tax=Aggregatimonas sangjinii TaxID=2583587 RepID=A0A5B7SJV0_9FLAO|nr:hypothetical protein [Aggregatimonas sangjinii]QCW98845.1 hypothetical protein FGM00_01435 [Aggregatimonas sangjinii]